MMKPKIPIHLVSIIAIVSTGLAILFTLLPIFTTPLIPNLALWRGDIKTNSPLSSSITQIRINVGFWGVCTSIKGSDDRYKRSICTKMRPAYAYKLSEALPDLKGDLNQSQTLFFFWYFFAVILSTIGLILNLLSFSGSNALRKIGTLCILTSSAISFGSFAATLVIFAELTAELMKSQSAYLIPEHTHILPVSFLPLISSLLLALSSGLFGYKYLYIRRLDRSASLDTTPTPASRSFRVSESSPPASAPESRPQGKRFWSRLFSSRPPPEKGEYLTESCDPVWGDNEELPPPPPLQDQPRRAQKKA